MNHGAVDQEENAYLTMCSHTMKNAHVAELAKVPGPREAPQYHWYMLAPGVLWQAFRLAVSSLLKSSESR